MRRAIRYGRNIGLTKPFLNRTAEVVFDIMKPAYPELGEASAFILNVIENEELRFGETLDTGLKLLNDSLADLRAAGKKEIPGDLIFKLYDTYGFPVDIVQDVVRDMEMVLDMKGFEADMADQRERSRSKVAFENIGEAYKPLSAQAFKPEFLGYHQLSAQSEVVLLVREGLEVQQADADDDIEVVTRETPFYGESGGQVGDRGAIGGDGLNIEVHQTIKDPTGIIIHKGKVISGRITKGQTVELTVDAEKRRATALNHTATHILHTALRQVLGEHVKQAGSMVAPDRLRFDFTHFAQVDAGQLERVECLVNEQVRANLPVQTDEMEAEQAFKSGAMALFEEKYGDHVRVVSLSDYSKELCGGTHTERTGNIGLFKIIAETSVAAGIRRIEALTGQPALDYVQQMAAAAQQAAHVLRIRPDAVVERVEQLLASQKQAEKEIEKLKSALADAKAQSGDDDVQTVNGASLLVKRVAVDNPAALRDLADRFKDRIQSGVVVLGSAANNKALLIVVVTKDLTDRFHAGNIVKALAARVGGGGGGRPDMAQAGGSKPEHLDEALAQAAQIIEAL
jgi:alanyl-tRNA synthetase